MKEFDVRLTKGVLAVAVTDIDKALEENKDFRYDVPLIKADAHCYRCHSKMLSVTVSTWKCDNDDCNVRGRETLVFKPCIVNEEIISRGELEDGD
jgi:hypothetical protein